MKGGGWGALTLGTREQSNSRQSCEGQREEVWEMESKTRVEKSREERVSAAD